MTGVLRRHNPRLDVRPVKSPEELEAIEPKRARRARLVAFVTPVVVPARILAALGFGAYNFHPGPPHYPGWVPAHFAIYDKAGISARPRTRWPSGSTPGRSSMSKCS